MIRIEPPFEIGDNIISWGKGDGITYEHIATNRNATSIDYCMEDSDMGQEINLHVLTDNLQLVLRQLGHLTSAELFRQYWEKYPISQE